MIWNCGHAANRVLTPEFIRSATGAQLHRFTWIPDSQIGGLNIEWNWLPDEFGENRSAKLIHFTLGTPCFHDFASVPMADEWHHERMLVNYALN